MLKLVSSNGTATERCGKNQKVWNHPISSRDSELMASATRNHVMCVYNFKYFKKLVNRRSDFNRPYFQLLKIIKQLFGNCPNRCVIARCLRCLGPLVEMQRLIFLWTLEEDFPIKPRPHHRTIATLPGFHSTSFVWFQ